MSWALLTMQILIKALKFVIPTSFALGKWVIIRHVISYRKLGASMELFMVHTGFYDIVTRKAGERLTDGM